MISYADLEFAIVRWKARSNGAAQPATPVTSGMVEGEIPVSDPAGDGDVAMQAELDGRED